MKFILYHIPKTGGQTITNSFSKHFTTHEELIHLGVDGIKDAKKKGLKDWKNRKKIERDKAKLVLVHYVDINTQNLFKIQEQAKHMIIFREPARHIISLYNFNFRNKKNPPSFKIWYLKQKLKGSRNWQATNFYRHFLKKSYIKSYFLNDVYFFKKILDSFFYVSVTKNIDRDLPILAKKMELDNFTVKSKNISVELKNVHYKLSESDREFLNRDNPLDFKIWQYACSRSNDFIS